LKAPAGNLVGRTRRGEARIGAHDRRGTGLARGLAHLLQELAQPLLHAGITPKHFGDMAASAFVKAACKASTLRNGRVNQSRVAVLTGLSRPEVRKLMLSARAPTSGKQPRTKRVIDGWTSDSRYVSQSGQPLSLRISGTRTSFASLVKKYAGDVPPKAVLEELRRMKVVRETDRRVQLTGTSVYPSAALVRSLASLLPVVSDGVGIASSSMDSELPPPIFRLTLKAGDTRDLAIMRERAVTGAGSFLNGLDRSLRGTAKLSRAPSKLKRCVTVTVLVREQETKRSIRR